jgi:hypothetical protein
MNANAADAQPGFVELQLLRHGPPHNQLLSPLTEYLALCGDHPNTTLRIPLEHRSLLTRLNALDYGDSEQTRVDQIRELARITSDLLAEVPGLIADLSLDRGDKRPFVHLSIASRASELALVPFELALAPDGFPGAGQTLCLQRQLPVCLTRRSRNVRNDDFVWDRRVKILFAASDAGGEIPVLQHYALLRKLVEPWVGTMPDDHEEAGRERKVRRVLRLLTDASVDKITQALHDEVQSSGKPFTHIHVLAHGCNLPESDRRSGIALHQPHRRGQIDAVDGLRLAQTLGYLPNYPSSANRHLRPSVVTLATCGSAGQGGVIIPGASLAFELHDSGIPLVVGSQFPLSTDGSIIMTEALYHGFLSGHDPRSTIWETRRALQAGLPQKLGTGTAVEHTAHDWASLTVYAALPADLDRVLPQHRCQRERNRMDVRLRNVHIMLGKPEDSAYWVDWEHFAKILDDAAREVRNFENWSRNRDNDDLEGRVSNAGILASAQKQIGLFYLRAVTQTQTPSPKPPPAEGIIHGWAQEGERWLRDSRATYRRLFDMKRDESWALVQFLALDFTLSATYDDVHWTVARELALLEQNAADPKRSVWALAALLELEFLSWLKADFAGHPLPPSGDSQSLARRIHDLFAEVPQEVLSAKRQFDRYVKEFAELAFLRKLPGPSDAGPDRYKRRHDARSQLASTPGPTGAASRRPAIVRIAEILQIFADLDNQR